MPWEPLPEQGREPTPVAEPLNQLMDRLAGASVSTIEAVMDSWPAIVGPKLASATAPAKIADGCLTVRTDDPIWATEVRWLEASIIDKVGALAGGTELTSLRVVVTSRG
jgi:hypothetical protein